MVKGATRLGVGSWNIGTLTVKSIELAKIPWKRKIKIACVQKTKWVGYRARDADGFKLWFSRSKGGQERESVGTHPRQAWMRRSRGISRRIWMRWCARVEHLVTFWSSVAKTQIYYIPCRRSNKGLFMDFKVIPSENLTTLHKLLVMDLEITRKKRTRVLYGQAKIKWESLTKDKAWELGVKLLTMVAWRSSEDASLMWTMTAQCIKEAAREVLGVSKGYYGGRNGDLW
uniref:Uncharacterized protein n=1 Tax=Nicotiana tabacum TaxID=4097 RepID=A0A1S3ZZ22_TOBAC|nr:PREDICTED: uncharacterized protein LOC107791978 [Nicotiana tabacum]